MSTAGEAWRKYRNGPVTFYGGWFVVLMAAGIGAFYLWKGPIKLHQAGMAEMARHHTFDAFEQRLTGILESENLLSSTRP